MRLPLHRFCSAVYAWMIERVQDPELFDYHLTKPVPGMKYEVTESVIRSEMDDFAALMGGGR